LSPYPIRKIIIDLNDLDRGCFVKAARTYGGVCSPGERELLKAICFATSLT